MINRICSVEKQKSIEEQISKILKNKKDIYFFGGLGSMSLGSVNAQYLERNHIAFKGFIANKRFIREDTYLGKPVWAIEDCEIPRDVNVIIGISNWVDAKKELQSRGFKNIFLFDSFAEIFLDKISLDYLKEHQEGFKQTYSMLEDEQSKQTMIAYLQGKVMHHYDGLAATYSGGGGIL